MQIDTRATTGGVTVIRVAGDMDLYNSSRLKDLIVSLWNKGERRIVLNLAELSYIDSSGIGVLLYIYTSGQKRNATVWYAGVNGSVLKVITLTKLLGFLPMTETVEEAIERTREAAAKTDEKPKQLGVLIDDASPLLQTTGMYHKTFHIDFPQIRRLSNLIAQQAPPEVREFNMLEQQISELIKNGVKHGNRNDKEKALDIWFSFSAGHAHLIVKDEGPGFRELERWNEFYRKKIECYRNQDFEQMMNYLAFRTNESDDHDGGNALFAAVEYWNEGVVFSNERNKVGVKRTFE